MRCVKTPERKPYFTNRKDCSSSCSRIRNFSKYPSRLGKKYKQEPKVIKQRTFRSEDQQTKEMERRIRDLEEENAILKRRCTSSQKTIGKISIYPSKPLHIPRKKERRDVSRRILHEKIPDKYKKNKNKKEIHCIFLESRCLYGSPKVTSLLRKAGRRISQKQWPES